MKIQGRAHKKDEKPFKCIMCGKRISESGYLKIDMRERFFYVGSMWQEHTGEIPFKCTKCGKNLQRTG